MLCSYIHICRYMCVCATDIELQVFRKTSTGPLARPAALPALILQTHQSMPHLGPARRWHCGMMQHEHA